MAIARVSGNILQDNLQRGANLSIQGNLAYFDVVNDRVGIGTDVTTHDLTVAGNLLAGNITIDSDTISGSGNITITPNGNISVSNVHIQDLQDPVEAQDAATKNYVDSALTLIFTLEDDALNTTNVADGDTVDMLGTANQVDVTVGNLSVTFALPSDVVIANSMTANTFVGNALGSSSDLALSTAANGNMSFTVAGTGIASFVSTTSLTIPVGNISQRPTVPETGAIRFNTGISQVEVYDGVQWEVVGSDFVSITNQVITGDGSTVNFTLDQTTTAAAIIVATNGVVQQPGVAYTVAGNVITFAEAPLGTDTIDVRFTAAVTTVNAISNISGNAEITVSGTGVANIATCDSLQLPSYTVATAANIVSPAAGQIIYVTNGDSGSPCLAVYSSSAWRRVSLGANIST